MAIEAAVDGGPFGVSPRHTSVPASQVLEPNPGARRHLVVAAEASESVRRLVRELVARCGPEPVELLCGGSVDGLTGGHRVRMCAPADLPDRVREALVGATTGLHVYVSGDDITAREVEAVALRCGLDVDEITVEVTGPRRRRVFCVHCKAVTVTGADEVAPCQSCGRQLFIYHHFSRRYRAYMGYQVDAEVPGDLPGAARDE